MPIYNTINVALGNNTGAKDSPAGFGGAMSYQAVWSGVDGGDSVLTVQYSNDGTNFEAIPSLSYTLVDTSGQVHFNINSVGHAFYRVVFTANSATSGTINIYVNA